MGAKGMIGCINEFVPEQDDWIVYSEKLEQYFRANAITDKGIQAATLLSLVGTATYKLLRDLCFPVLPKEKSFDELSKLLASQYSPHVSVFRERIKFYASRQEEYENSS